MYYISCLRHADTPLLQFTPQQELLGWQLGSQPPTSSSTTQPSQTILPSTLGRSFVSHTAAPPTNRSSNRPTNQSRQTPVNNHFVIHCCCLLLQRRRLLSCSREHQTNITGSMRAQQSAFAKTTAITRICQIRRRVVPTSYQWLIHWNFAFREACQFTRTHFEYYFAACCCRYRCCLLLLLLCWLLFGTIVSGLHTYTSMFVHTYVSICMSASIVCSLLRPNACVYIADFTLPHAHCFVVVCRRVAYSSDGNTDTLIG